MQIGRDVRFSLIYYLFFRRFWALLGFASLRYIFKIHSAIHRLFLVYRTPLRLFLQLNFAQNRWFLLSWNSVTVHLERCSK